MISSLSHYGCLQRGRRPVNVKHTPQSKHDIISCGEYVVMKRGSYSALGTFARSHLSFGDSIDYRLSK